MDKKYELTQESKVFFGITLYRIKALKSFNNIEAGELGGFIEKEENLNQSDDAWVYGDAQVYGNAQVSGNARVYGNAWDKSPLQIQGTAWFVCMCTKTTLKIGCHEHTIDEWLGQYREIGKRNGASDEVIAEYLLYIQLAQKLYCSEVETKENE